MLHLETFFHQDHSLVRQASADVRNKPKNFKNFKGIQDQISTASTKKVAPAVVQSKG
jgi:hypothetical protein